MELKWETGNITFPSGNVEIFSIDDRLKKARLSSPNSSLVLPLKHGEEGRLGEQVVFFRRYNDIIVFIRNIKKGRTRDTYITLFDLNAEDDKMMKTALLPIKLEENIGSLDYDHYYNYAVLPSGGTGNYLLNLWNLDPHKNSIDITMLPPALDDRITDMLTKYDDGNLPEGEIVVRNMNDPHDYIVVYYLRFFPVVYRNNRPIVKDKWSEGMEYVIYDGKHMYYFSGKHSFECFDFEADKFRYSTELPKITTERIYPGVIYAEHNEGKSIMKIAYNPDNVKIIWDISFPNRISVLDIGHDYIIYRGPDHVHMYYDLEKNTSYRLDNIGPIYDEIDKTIVAVKNRHETRELGKVISELDDLNKNVRSLIIKYI